MDSLIHWTGNQDRTTSETGTLACYDAVLQTVYTLPPLIFVPTYLKVFWWPYSARGADPRDVISRTPQKPNHPIPPVDRAHFCASKCTQFRASRHSRAAFSEPDTKAERKCRKCPKWITIYGINPGVTKLQSRCM